MTRKTMLDVGSDIANITAAFFVRNAVVLTGLSVAVLLAMSN